MVEVEVGQGGELLVQRLLWVESISARFENRRTKHTGRSADIFFVSDSSCVIASLSLSFDPKSAGSDLRATATNSGLDDMLRVGSCLRARRGPKRMEGKRIHLL